MYFGIDPEFFIIAPDGKAVSAHVVGIPPKWEKVGVQHSYDPDYTIGGYFRDNYGAEVNIRPSYCRDHVRDRTGAVIAALRRRAQAQNGDLSSAAAVPMDPIKELADAPPDVKEWGCNPSYDAYKLVAKRPDMDPMTVPLRTAGGHVHLATDNIECTRVNPPWCSPDEEILLHPEAYPDLIKLLDAYMGTRLAMVFDDPMQWKRREIYGQAGEFRPQIYEVATEGIIIGRGRTPAMGVEYRTPPPALFNTPESISYFLGIARWVVHNYKSLHASYDKAMETYVQEAINTGRGAEAVAKRFPIPKHPLDALKKAKPLWQELKLDKLIEPHYLPR